MDLGELYMPRSCDGHESCPVARTLAVVGDRWTALVLRDLVQGKQRYNELLESLDGISPNLLADRLRRLEAEGVVKRSLYCKHPPRAEYQLTRKGMELAKVVREMRNWGQRYKKRRSP